MVISVQKNVAVKMAYVRLWMVHVIVLLASQARTVISRALRDQLESTVPNSVTVPCMELVISSLENASKHL